MDGERILLLDFNSTGGLGFELKGMLESSNGNLTTKQDYVVSAPSSPDLNRVIARYGPAVICSILPQAPLKQVIALVETIKAQAPKTPVAIISEAREPDELFRLLQAGAADFITPPLRAFDILPRILRLVEHARRSDCAAYSMKERVGLKQLIGANAAFMAEIKKIPIVARSDAGVLICGETGTGKELCGRAIHYLSPRSAKPFLPVNCGAIPAELLENELFGHERGAFTDASSSRFGLIHEAEGGTLFLDEVDAIPPLAQVKLLRFLQDKEYRALGSGKTRKADVRVIAATNADLDAAVASGQLRTDFYYRLSTIQLTLPPLRERRDDIPLFARVFLSRYAAQYDKKIDAFSPGALQSLLLYHWPGNVRELEHAIERAVVMTEDSHVKECDISLPRSQGQAQREGFKEAKAKIIAQFEKSYIQSLLVAFQGNITRAAQAANKNRRAFWQLIRKHRIDVQSFKPSA